MLTLPKLTRGLIGASISALLFALCLAGPAGATEPEPPELDWEALVPQDWHPEERINALYEEYKVDELDDADPRARELSAQIDAIYAEAPVVAELDGRPLRLPGFVVPLGKVDGAMRELLLVPYYGACVHVPPPPANQTIYVRMNEGQGYVGKAFDTVMVAGTLHVERSQYKLADAGYRIDAERVAPYTK